MKRSLLIGMLCLVILGSAALSRGGEKSGYAGDPKRSYGSINVILYVTSW